ncbi:hypothetical protein CCUG60884_00213 [Mycobacteroides salmoniphilum]|uniref:HTH cro/C1-type domain-containing protein n=1 Tax=Mycobacteroides salmoniphilum TaxID=404941 RepID=A0A4R8T046_9MYCO|nr:hypothetical protein CCUG60884_00213 [Mycobacteroides salmoniphilum]
MGLAIAARREDPRINLTQKQLADKIHVHANTISANERGVQGMRPGTRILLEQALRWRKGGYAFLLENPDADPASVNEDPPTGTQMAVDVARQMLEMARELIPQVQDSPEARKQIAERLQKIEERVNVIVQYDFTQEALQTLMELNTTRLSLED